MKRRRRRKTGGEEFVFVFHQSNGEMWRGRWMRRKNEMMMVLVLVRLKER